MLCRVVFRRAGIYEITGKLLLFPIADNLVHKPAIVLLRGDRRSITPRIPIDRTLDNDLVLADDDMSNERPIAPQIISSARLVRIDCSEVIRDIPTMRIAELRGGCDKLVFDEVIEFLVLEFSILFNFNPFK